MLKVIITFGNRDENSNCCIKRVITEAQRTWSRDWPQSFIYEHASEGLFLLFSIKGLSQTCQRKHNKRGRKNVSGDFSNFFCIILYLYLLCDFKNKSILWIIITTLNFSHLNDSFYVNKAHETLRNSSMLKKNEDHSDLMFSVSNSNRKKQAREALVALNLQ